MVKGVFCWYLRSTSWVRESDIIKELVWFNSQAEVDEKNKYYKSLVDWEDKLCIHRGVYPLSKTELAKQRLNKEEMVAAVTKYYKPKFNLSSIYWEVMNE